MIKKLFFITVLVVSAGTCFSQSDYREGYIINLSNDTIPGFINNKGSFKNLKQCRFKSSPEVDFVDYTPEEIKAFRIYSAGYYVSMEVEMNGNRELVFIEKLVDGIVDVFYHKVHNEAYYLLRTDEGELYELKNSKVEVANNEGNFTREKKEYIRILRYLFSDSPRTINKVDRLPFETNAIIDIAQEYHNDVCSENECTVYTKEKAVINFDYGLYAGYSLSNFSLESEYISKMNNTFSSSNDMLFGLFLNIMDPNISERFSLQLDVIFQNGKYVFDSTYFKISNVRVPFSIKYTYPVKKIQPSLQLGVAYNKWYNYEAKYIIPEHIIGDAIQKRGYQYGILISTEVSYQLAKNLGLFAQCKYEKYSGKPWNSYKFPDGNGNYIVLQESVEAKTDFISFSLGLKF